MKRIILLIIGICLLHVIFSMEDGLRFLEKDNPEKEGGEKTEADSEKEDEEKNICNMPHKCDVAGCHISCKCAGCSKNEGAESCKVCHKKCIANKREESPCVTQIGDEDIKGDAESESAASDTPARR